MVVSTIHQKSRVFVGTGFVS